MDYVYKDLRKMKRGRKVPPWAVPKEIWELVFRATEHPHDMGKQWGRMAHEMQKFLQHVHYNQLGPRDWYDAGGAQIPKNNGKKKCLSVRTVSTLDAMGKLFYRRIWKAKPRFGNKPHHAHGFLPKRRKLVTFRRTSFWQTTSPRPLLFLTKIGS